MKKNLLLFVGLISLIGLTWLLTEGGWKSERPKLEVYLQEALKNPKSIELPNVVLTADQEGVWRTGGGEVARAEMLDEWHKSVESLTIARVIEKPANRAEFFASAFRIEIDEQVFEFGDLTPSSDSFYLGMPGDPDVYVVDLNSVGSLAVSDDENTLLAAKYQRLRDLLSAPEDIWREHRLLHLVRIAGFEEWTKGDLKLNGKLLSARPWGKAVMQGFLAGLQSLTVKGAILTQKPHKRSKIASWHFQLSTEQKIVWEFFEHPSLDLIYVWVPHLGKAYPLDEDSSYMVGVFPERLFDRIFTMTLGADEVDESFEEKGAVVKANAKTQLLNGFMQQEQTFNQLSVLSKTDCLSRAAKAQFVLKEGPLTYHWRRGENGWTILECAAGLSWDWRLPIQSKLDFTMLSSKD